MSYILTKFRVSQPIVARLRNRQIRPYSKVFSSNTQHFSVLNNQQYKCSKFNPLKIQFYSVAAVKNRPFVRNTERLPKILEKLKHNVVSLPFDDFSMVRKNALKSYRVTVQEGFEIMKSCSQLVDRSSEIRLNLVNDVWGQLLDMIKTPSKQRLIELLQAYRRCGDNKTVDNYLQILHQFDCAVDIEIFEELMYIACENSDTMEQANQILKDMAAVNLEPTEKIYNAMILGYAKEGVEASENVLKIMEEKNISATASTYTELIKSYIINGKTEKALDALNKSKEFESKHFFEIIRWAAIHAKEEKIIVKVIEMLPLMLRNAKWIDQNLQNICIELIHLNKNRSPDHKLDPFSLIIRHLPVPEFQNENTGEYGNFLLKEMLATNESVPNVLKLCETLIKTKRNERAIHFCCVMSLVHKLPNANDYLRALSEKEPLRPHYFRPLIVNAKTENELLDVINLATKLNVSIDTQTLLLYVLPRLPLTLGLSQAGIKVLQDKGVRLAELKTAIIAHLIDECRPSEAYEIAKISSAIIDPVIVSKSIIKFIRSKEYLKNNRTIANLIKKLGGRVNRANYDFAGQLTVRLMSGREVMNDFPLSTQLLNDYANVGVSISRHSADLILEKVYKNRDIYIKLKSIVENLVNKDIIAEGPQDESTKRIESTTDKLEKQLAELQANNFPVHGVLYRLFIAYVAENRLDRAVELLKKCDEAGVVDTPAMLSTKLKLFTSIKDANKALSVLRKLQKNSPKFRIDVYKIVDLATLLITDDRIDEANEVLEEFSAFNKNTNIKYMSNNVWRLLNAVCEHATENQSEENLTEKQLAALVKLNYCKYTNAFLAVVMKEYLNKNDIKNAVLAFKRFASEHRTTPYMVMLLTKLIEIANCSENAEHPMDYNVTKQEASECLQNVIDTTNDVHGAGNANVNVILAFACAGTEQQLRRILMNPALKFDGHNLETSLQYFKDQLRIDAIIMLARCSRGLQHKLLNEENLYGLLLKHFSITNDYESALDFYERFSQDGELRLAPKFGKALVDLLIKNEQNVPDKLRLYIQ